MADYLHGAYGQINDAGNRVADIGQQAIVYIGTAPVNQVEGGANYVNRPVLIQNIAEAKKFFGYSDDWAAFTLCEAMYTHLQNKAVGPIVLINVLDPAVHKAAEKTTKSVTPVNGKATVADAELAIVDTLVVKSGSTTKTKGTDYSVSYNPGTKDLTIAELTAGALGTTALTIEYFAADPAAVTTAQVVGQTDGLGTNTGIYAVKSVYQATGKIPAFLAAPGFSSIPEVNTALCNLAQKINKHWDAYVFADLPLVNGSTPITLATAVTFKNANGYNRENETVYFPMVTGTDGRNYHISTLAAANFQELLLGQDGIPFRSASNTACPIISNLYLGDTFTGVVDDELINDYLNKNGIASACFVGGRWAIWGAHSADYSQAADRDIISVAETNRMMLFYVSNDFQARRPLDVDRPMTANDLETIAAEEQARLDALVKIGALLYGEVTLNATAMTDADIINGDFSFTFNITTTPLAKSLTALVNWTDIGFVTYFSNGTAEEVTV